MRGARIWQRVAGTAVACAAMVALAGAPAQAAQAGLVAGPYAAVTGFATPQVVVLAGDELSFANADVMAHSVLARDLGPAGPLFSSTLATIGQSVPVNGISSLAPGSYDFVCSLHGSMTGTITVLPR